VPGQRRAPVRRVGGKSAPHHLQGFDPPAAGVDTELDAVTEAILLADATGETFAYVLRETYDQLYDGQRTGRYRWDQLMKTEKTYMGTLVEINLQRAFEFPDGQTLDYRIAGVETDCKYSQSLGGWEIPPESYDGAHICLVVWASEEFNRWEAGLVRPKNDGVMLAPPNRDQKRKLTPQGESTIRWLYDTPALPENLLLHIDDATRERILNPTPERRRRPSGQQRLNMLFRLVQGRIVNRATVMTLGQQKDPPKRARDARLPHHLGSEGILVFGHQESDPLVAEALGLPRPIKGEFVSIRVVPAEDDFAGPKAEIEGRWYRIATDADPVTPAPLMPRAGRRED
jgi:hypothetical protein